MISLILFFVITPAYGQLLSDATGLVNRLDVQTAGRIFEVETISNFDIQSFDFDGDEKKLTIHIISGLEKNLGEVLIPQNLLGGNFTFYLNDQEFFPKVNSNEKISFITLNFTGSGNNKLDIIGDTYLNGLTENADTTESSPQTKPGLAGGCLIATATYGSELAPQVQQLREIRDNKLLQTESGIVFMNSFNDFYYSFSPYIADLEREYPIFKETVKLSITPMLSTLTILNYVDINSEQDMLSYGLGIILMNLGMYIAAPVIVVMRLCKFKSKLCWD